MPTVIALSLTDVHTAVASHEATPGQRRVKTHLVRSIDGCDSEALLAQSRQFVSPLEASQSHALRAMRCGCLKVYESNRQVASCLVPGQQKCRCPTVNDSIVWQTATSR